MEYESIAVNSPIGKLVVTGSVLGIQSVNLSHCEVDNISTNPELLKCALQLSEYFEGRRKKFDVNLHISGTAFQQNVWSEIMKIELGSTSTYSEIARRLNLHQNSSRAIGLASGKNPFLIIVPCHRVIGVNGKLTGYAGGMDRKRWLLMHERKNLQSDTLLF